MNLVYISVNTKKQERIGEKMSKEVHNEQDKKVLGLANELSELLVAHKYEETWERVGELNSLLKKKEELTLPSYMIDALVQHVKSYYYQNNQVKKARTAMTAIGHKLADFK